MGDDSLSITKKDEIKFSPGSLTLETIDVLGYCYTDVDIYKDHFRKRVSNGVRIAISDEYKLIYRFIPKSGSSTARTIMRLRFSSYEGHADASLSKLGDRKWANYTAFTFIRDPLSRFFSSYDEAYHREKPWKVKKSKAPEYLYTGIRNERAFTDIWCPRGTRNKTKECHDGRRTKENGTLAERLERYVRETDFLSPFNIHLNLQVPLISDPKTGLKRLVDEIYEIGDESWEKLARSHGVNIWEPIEKNGKNQTGVPHARSRTRTADLSQISNSTKQRICGFGLLDYCCLNMPLPPPCENLFCRLHHGGENGNRLQIQPWSFPPSQVLSKG